MYKFKASKFKNATPKVPRKENCITDLNIGSPLYSTIKSSAAFVACNVDARGSGCLAVLSLNCTGRQTKDLPLLNCHADAITDFDFSPFDDGLLATCSQESSIKLWSIPETGVGRDVIINPEVSLNSPERRMECLAFHPTADFLLSSCSGRCVRLWDLTRQDEFYCNNDAGDVLLSMSWKLDGSLLATTARDQILRIYDPRNSKNSLNSSCNFSAKESKVLWLGDMYRILATGLDSSRQRQILIRDIRNLSRPIKAISHDTSPGSLLTVFDPDTNMLFVSGKADMSIALMEISDSEPIISESSRHICDQQVKGICLVPKWGLDVMSAEVARLMQLTPNSIVPLSYCVPRKSYRDFHTDLFPETKGFEPATRASSWWAGDSAKAAKFNLDPSRRPKQSYRAVRTNLSTRIKQSTNNAAHNSSDDHSDGSTFLNQSMERVTVDDRREYSNGRLSEHNSSSQSSDSENPFNTTPKPRPRKFNNAESPKALEASNGTSMPVAPPRRSRSLSLTEGIESKQLRAFPANNGTVATPDTNVVVTRRLNNGSIVAKLADGYAPGNLSNSFHASADRNRFNKTEMNGHSNWNDAPSSSPKPVRALFNRSESVRESTPESPQLSRANPARASKVFGFRTSKYRHLKGTCLHKSTHIDGIRGVSSSTPGECDVFHVNTDRVALPLTGVGGQMAIFELSKSGRLPDTLVPVLQSGTTIMDFAWDCFDNRRIAIAGDDGKVRFWNLPANGLTDTLTNPSWFLSAHSEKIYFVKFHPLAKNILATGSYDLTVKIWDISTCPDMESICLRGHTDQIFSFAWSPNGQLCCTVCKDNKIRIYEPRKSQNPIRTGPGPTGSRGARIFWALDGKLLVVSGFDKVSERQIMVYKSIDLAAPLTTLGLDSSPSILIPHYDEDSSVMFLTGKGDSTIFTYEVIEESPYLLPLSHHKCPNSHQALDLLPKAACNVRDVEFAKALRLTLNHIEPISFAVPRVKVNYFQDDLFPETRVTSQPVMSSADWLAGKNALPVRVSLRPEGMIPLSEANAGGATSTPAAKLNSSFIAASSPFDKGEKQKAQEMAAALSRRVNINRNDVLPQERMEGVDPSEWDD